MSLDLKFAKEVIDRFKGARATCDDKCEWRPYTPKLGMPDGFDFGDNRNGMVRRCEACACTPQFPWLAKLDVERVARWIQEHAASGKTAFHVDELKVLL